MSIQDFTYSNIENTASRIKAFRQIQSGWHYGTGLPPSQETVNTALKLNVEARYAGFPKTNAFLGTDGEIRVTAYHGPLYLELTVEASGKVTLLLEQGDTEIAYEENLSLQEALAQMRKLRGLTWALSGLSISTTTTTIEGVSKVSLSSHPVMAAASLSLMQIAFYEQAQASANILRDTTKASQEPPLSSGTYIPGRFLRSAASSNKQTQEEMIAIITS